MKRLLAPLLALLTACGVTAPPRDTGQWTSTVHGVEITWRLNQAQALGAWDGLAHSVLGGKSCVVDVNATARAQLTRLAAHEAGHCLQAAFLLPGFDRADIAPYFADPKEGFAESYARAYLKACGDSLKPLGWQDANTASCTEAPDPRTITGVE